MKVSGTQRRELIEKALAAREYSYSPYSPRVRSDQLCGADGVFQSGFRRETRIRRHRHYRRGGRDGLVLSVRRLPPGNGGILCA